ncbi:hypothetical protein MKW94_029256 [Papaver nudicaule]|uniref:Cytochrome P450 n=1 Tax=Papaver nudicaule TaxID=74823 RepID=A0AA41S9V9_PAPNU|nr:hypothetical protein [Papaver nudicaule]
MLDQLGFSISWLILVFILPISIIFIIRIISIRSSSTKLPKSYPLIGSTFAILSNKHRMNQWMADVLQQCATRTFVMRGFVGPARVWTANPENVKHILQTQFPNYPKGEMLTGILSDFLGNGIFNTDGNNWKLQRKLASHEFNTKSLRKFIEDVVKIELSDRLIPILETTADQNSVLDLQDILQRFAFDNICKISFGFDPAYLSPSLDRTEFATAFDDATRLSTRRFGYVLPFKKLRQAILTVRESARKLVKKKQQELKKKSSVEATDLLSRFIRDDDLDDDFVIDIVISFILAGQDSTSAALTWFFWLVSCHPNVERGILEEIDEISDQPGYEDAKEMVYIHAALSESMRLYPPVPNDSKQAAGDDVLPDGTNIKKGMRVIYSPYAMGRMDNLWGWLDIDKATGKSQFVSRDPYTYPVVVAGPRMCLGKEMSFLQMKMLVVEISRRFQVVPAEVTGFEPVFVSFLTSKMKGEFPVKIQRRI